MDEATAPVSGKRSPTRNELAVWRDYIETSEAVKRALAADFQATCGMSPADYEVMLALSEAPNRLLRSSELAETIGWERSRLSHHLRRMEDRKLILRHKVDGDSRGAAVTLTDAGADLFRKSSTSHLRVVRDVFIDAFTPEQLSAMQTAVQALRTHLQKRPTTGC